MFFCVYFLPKSMYCFLYVICITTQTIITLVKDTIHHVFFPFLLFKVFKNARLVSFCSKEEDLDINRVPCSLTLCWSSIFFYDVNFSIILGVRSFWCILSNFPSYFVFLFCSLLRVPRQVFGVFHAKVNHLLSNKVLI